MKHYLFHTFHFFFLLILLNNSALTQTCKYERNEIDDFSENRIIESISVDLVSKFMEKNYIDVSILIEGDQSFLSLRYQLHQFTNEDYITETDDLYLKLGGGAGVLKVSPDNTYRARENKEYRGVAGSDFQIIELKSKYILDSEDLQKLAKFPVEKIKYSIRDKSDVYQYDIKSKIGSKLRDQAKCILIAQEK